MDITDEYRGYVNVSSHANFKGLHEQFDCDMIRILML